MTDNEQTSFKSALNFLNKDWDKYEPHVPKEEHIEAFNKCKDGKVRVKDILLHKFYKDVDTGAIVTGAIICKKFLETPIRIWYDDNIRFRTATDGKVLSDTELIMLDPIQSRLTSESRYRYEAL